MDINESVFYGDNKYYKLDPLMKEALFFNKIFKNIEYNFNESGIDYKINSDSYRSSEFIKNVDLLIGGCSNTYGCGIPEESIWGVQVANHFNMSYVNLGIPGASINTIIDNIFAYIKKFGTPKNIVCIFPDPWRIRFPLNFNILIAKDRENAHDKEDIRALGENYFTHGMSVNRNFDSLPKYSKLPHQVENVLSPDYVYWNALKAIQVLEQYCEVAGINLYWSVWDSPTYKAISYMREIDNTYYKDMIDIGSSDWVQKKIGDSYKDSYINQYCHAEVEEKYKDVFHIAADRAHFGVHKNTHFAEAFIKEMSEMCNG